jgi:hypothetical protein
MHHDDLQTTYHVVCLARWMAADMYLREVDALRFELSMSTCSTEVSRVGCHAGRQAAWGLGHAGCSKAVPLLLLCLLLIKVAKFLVSG